ncbi:hypothetical protein BT93_K1891 [Corymbia citriodora subsp. variegata]|nr:hypothetical protein BT93_K1891 [Corymbia citriodora subsp. variegata]
MRSCQCSEPGSNDRCPWRDGSRLPKPQQHRALVPPIHSWTAPSAQRTEASVGCMGTPSLSSKTESSSSPASSPSSTAAAASPSSSKSTCISTARASANAATSSRSSSATSPSSASPWTRTSASSSGRSSAPTRFSTLPSFVGTRLRGRLGSPPGCIRA